MLLYILKFKDQNLIKIGITTSLNTRINSLTKDLKVQFDLMESFIITGKSSGQIQALEKQLLHDLAKDKLPDNHTYQVPNNSRMKDSEIRLDRNLEIALRLLREKIKMLSLSLKIYEGIDLSGFRSDVIPLEIIPFDGQIVNGWVPIIESGFEQLAVHYKMDRWLFHQEIIYKWLLTEKFDFNIPPFKRKDNCFLALQ